MINTYTGFNQYIAGLASSHKEIADHIYGDTDHIISHLENADFPIAIWESPSIGHVGDEDSLGEIWACSIQFVASQSTDDYDEEKKALDTCLSIARDFRNKLLYDAEDMGFEIDVRIMKIDPIQSVFANNYWGWSLELAISMPSAACDLSNFE